MRELKFRGYLKKENKMYPVCDLNFNGVDQWAVGISSCGRLDCGICEDHYERADVEVMQYTGLKDKNGHEIYEGDVISVMNTFRAEVIYEAPSFKLRWRDKYQVKRKAANKTIAWNAHIIYEVIGNIYENPELLGDIK